MSEKITRKKMKSFRIEPALEPEVQEISERLDRPESWIINQCLKIALPQLKEQTAKAA